MKSIKVPLPVSSSDETLELAKKVLAKHIADGDQSRLITMPWETLQPAIEKAVKLHEDAENYLVQRKMSIQERNKLLREVKNAIRGSRNVLSGIYPTSMQSLGEWGFNVVETNFTRRKATKTGSDQVPPAQPPDTSDKV